MSPLPNRGEIRAMYDELLDLLVGSADVHRALAFRFSSLQQERLDMLLEKNREGTLTAEETAELDYPFVLIFVQQGFEPSASLRTILGEHIALAYVGRTVAAGERWLVEGDVADEVEGVYSLANFFK